MATNFVIRQSVRSIKECRHEVVFSTQCERTARYSYKEAIKDYPDEYFELVKVEHAEECLEYTATMIG